MSKTICKHKLHNLLTKFLMSYTFQRRFQIGSCYGLSLVFLKMHTFSKKKISIAKNLLFLIVKKRIFSASKKLHILHLNLIVCMKHFFCIFLFPKIIKFSIAQQQHQQEQQVSQDNTKKKNS